MIGRAHSSAPQSCTFFHGRGRVCCPVPSETSMTSWGSRTRSTSASAHMAGLAAKTPPSTREKPSRLTGSK